MHAHAARVGEAAEQRVCGRQGQMAGGSRHLRMRQLQERWEFEAGRWGFHEGKLQPGLQEPVFFRGEDTGQLVQAGRKREEMERARDDETIPGDEGRGRGL